EPPTISAPARMLFPGLAQGQEWHNFTLVNRDGATLRLAMPFSHGLTITAENRGKSPLAGVSGVASVLPAERNRGQPIFRFPLRSFLVNGKVLPLQFHGMGRLVGVVRESHQGKFDGEIWWSADGQPIGQSGQTWDTFLGCLASGDIRKPLSGRVGDLSW